MFANTISIFMLDQSGCQTRTPPNRTSMGTAPLRVGSLYGSNSYEEFSPTFTDEIVNSFILKHALEPFVRLDSVLANENVHSAVSSGCERSGSISRHVMMNVAEVLASDELVQLLRGKPTPISASGKKFGGILRVLARAS